VPIEVGAVAQVRPLLAVEIFRIAVQAPESAGKHAREHAGQAAAHARQDARQAGFHLGGGAVDQRIQRRVA
jgi:hypothetical protein